MKTKLMTKILTGYQKFLGLMGLGLLLAVHPLPVSAQNINYAEFLPGNTAFFIHIADISSVEDKLREGPLGTLLENEELHDFLGPMIREFKSEGSMNFTPSGDDSLFWEYFQNWVTGGFTIAATMAEDLDEEGEFLIIADFSGTREDLDSIMEFFSDEANPTEGMDIYAFDEEYLGVSLRIEEVFDEDGELVRRNGWTLIDNTAVIAHPDTFLKDTVARIVEPGTLSSLSDQNDFRDVFYRGEATDIMAYFHLGTILPLFEKGFFDGYNNAMTDEDAQLQEFFSAEGLFQSLQLDNLKSFFLSSVLMPDQIKYDLGFTYNQRVGVTRLLAYERAPLDGPSIAPTNAISASIYNFRLGEVWDFLMETFAASSPMFHAMVQQQLEMFTDGAGVDFHADFFGNFDGEIQTFSTERVLLDGSMGAPDEEPFQVDQVIALRLTDSSRFQRALDSLLSATGLDGFLEDSEIADRMVRLVRIPMDEESGDFFSYSISPTYLYLGIGKPEILQETFQRLDQHSTDIWSREDLQRAFRMLPRSEVSRSFIDLESMFDAWVDMMVFVNQTMPVDAQFVDPAFKPQESAFPFFMISVGDIQDDGFFMEGIILSKDLLDE